MAEDAAISLRLPSHLRAALSERARTEQRSVEDVIVSILLEALPGGRGSRDASRAVSEHVPASESADLPKPDRDAPG